MGFTGTFIYLFIFGICSISPLHLFYWINVLNYVYSLIIENLFNSVCSIFVCVCVFWSLHPPCVCSTFSYLLHLLATIILTFETSWFNLNSCFREHLSDDWQLPLEEDITDVTKPSIFFHCFRPQLLIDLNCTSDGFCEFYLELGVADKESHQSLIDHHVLKTTPQFLLPKPDTFIDGCEEDFNVLSAALRSVFFDCITASSLQMASRLKHKQQRWSSQNPDEMEVVPPRASLSQNTRRGNTGKTLIMTLVTIHWCEQTCCCYLLKYKKVPVLQQVSF